MRLTREKRVQNACLALKPALKFQRLEPSQELDIDILARTLWGEARGEGVLGMEAVACVIMNRFKTAQENDGYWWGQTIREICQKPYQFSCWNIDDPNLSKIKNLDLKDALFKSAKNIARLYALGFGKDITDGATHYHAKSVQPYWAKALVETGVIGNHIFYKLKA